MDVKASAAKDSPEKKLLEIIEGGKKEVAGAEGMIKSAAIKQFKKGGSFSMVSFVSNIPAAFNKLKTSLSSGLIVSGELRKINTLLMFVTVGLVFYVAGYFIFSMNSKDKSIVLSMEDTKTLEKNTAQSKIALGMSPDTSLARFLEKTRKRDLFKPVKKSEEARSVGLDKTSVKGAEILKNLKLVGISPAADPKDSEAMVEDATSKITYFLKKDETILGMKVVSIEEDKIIFNYQGTDVELH